MSLFSKSIHFSQCAPVLALSNQPHHIRRSYGGERADLCLFFAYCSAVQLATTHETGDCPSPMEPAIIPSLQRRNGSPSSAPLISRSVARSCRCMPSRTIGSPVWGTSLHSCGVQGARHYYSRSLVVHCHFAIFFAPLLTLTAIPVPGLNCTMIVAPFPLGTHTASVKVLVASRVVCMSLE